jgi:Asp-tRNA(Asn)/Glu-tRNA(Gln) amidotransferase A subunit family amidase
MDALDLSKLSLADLQAGYADLQIDPVEVMEITFDQIDRVNEELTALYNLRRDDSFVAAKEARRRFRDGKPAGPLDGVPVSIKDSVNAAGMVWHHGSTIHGDGVVAKVDSPPVEKLKAAGAIIFGKGAMPDFGLSGSGVSSYHGIVRNPWGKSWNPGGSSAGAGASLAAGIGMMSVGTDIAGSVRLPSSHCGLATIKPTQGMIAHTPASDVRSPGPMVRHAVDLEAYLRILGGVHAADRFSVPVTEPERDFGEATVAVHGDFGFGPSVEPAVRQALQTAETAMGRLVRRVVKGSRHFDFDAMLPMDDSFKLRGWREYASVSEDMRANTPAEIMAWFAEAEHWDGNRIARFEAGIAKGVAQANTLFDDADFLLTPVMPVVNFPATERGPDPMSPLRHCTFTAPFNQSGHPAAAICAGFDARGLPIGVQIVGKRFDDIRLCRLAAALETEIWGNAAQDRDWPLAPRD